MESIDFIDSMSLIDPIDSILVPHKRPPTFTPHTKGARAARAPTTIPMGRALRARPIGIVVVPFVCGVNVGDLLCGTRIAFIESIESTKSIESIESVESIESCRDCKVYIRATQKTANIHTTHKGKNNSTDGGGAEGAAPIGTVVCARAARAPLCVV